MFKLSLISTFTMLQCQASAWEQRKLLASSQQSSTAHDGVSWISSPQNTTANITQAFLASGALLLAWSDSAVPQLFEYSATSSSWGASPHVAPLASKNIIDVSASTVGQSMVLVSVVANTYSLVQ